MFNKKTYDIFVNNNRLTSNDYDTFYGRSIPSNIRNKARQNFGVNSIDEEILLVRDTSFWNSCDQGTVITDWGVYCIPDNDNLDSRFSFSWLDVHHVVYKDEVFYFYNHDDDYAFIHKSDLLKNDSPFTKKLAWIFNEMANSQEYVDVRVLLDEYIKSVDDRNNDICQLEDKGVELINSDLFSDWGKALVISEIMRAFFLEANEIFNDESRYKDLDFNTKLETRHNYLEKINNYGTEALKFLSEEDLPKLIGEISYYIAWAFRCNEQHLQSMRLAIHALGISNDDTWNDRLKSFIGQRSDNGLILPTWGYGIYGDSIEYWQKTHEEDRQRDLQALANDTECNEKDKAEMVEFIEEDHQDWLRKFDDGPEFFSHRPYQERQFIFTVRDLNSIAGCYDPSNNINYVFPLDMVPKDIFFPMGHPQPNTLYIAHPLRPYYMPAEDANLALFYEKIRELSRMLQCLGATSITLRCLKGKQITEQVDNLMSVDANVDYKLADASMSYSQFGSSKINTSSRHEMEETKHYNPTKLPYCPDDLLWVAMDPDLSGLISQRMDGGLLTFNKRVSSRETLNISSSCLNEVKSAFNTFMLKVSANYNTKEDRTFSETDETLWEISAEFKPLSEFKPNVETIELETEIKELPKSLKYSAVEEEYLEEYKYVISDGEIGDRERRSLERLRNKLGISAERAKGLEDSILISSLTDAEKEYLEEYRYQLEEGEIGERERRTLERLRTKLGLTKEQSEYLEKLS